MRSEVRGPGCLYIGSLHNLSGEAVNTGGDGVCEGAGPPEGGRGSWHLVAGLVSRKVPRLVVSCWEAERLWVELLLGAEVMGEGVLVPEWVGGCWVLMMGDDGGLMLDVGDCGLLVGQSVRHDDVDVWSVGS